jgi:crotonobetainyl-CoA:carnitine CoA-transferase CaiB-like acyl-CoA transferase
VAADGGAVAISASTPRQQQTVTDLLDAAGVPAGGASLRDRTRAWIAGVTRAEAAQALVDARIPATPVHDLAELRSDPQIAHRASLIDLDGVTVARPTPVIDGPHHPPTTAALGEANDDVLGGWLGLSRVELDDLHARGIV